jgi:hypothetical protein
MYPEDSYVGYFLKYDPEWRSGDYGWVFNIYTNQPYVCSGVKLATLEQAELCSEVLKNELAKKERKKK